MPAKKADEGADRGLAKDQDLYSGLIRLHVLHHAIKEPIFGLGIMEELARHGIGLVLELCIRCFMAWKKRVIYVLPRRPTESRGAGYIEPPPSGEKCWRMPRIKSAKYFTNSLKIQSK